MRKALGDGYTQGLQSAYRTVPGSTDDVIIFWHEASQRVIVVDFMGLSKNVARQRTLIAVGNIRREYPSPG